MKTVFMKLDAVVVLIVFTLLVFLSGCATVALPKPVITSINKFPAFTVPDGTNIDPESDIVGDVNVLALSEDMKITMDESLKGIKNPRKRLITLVGLIDDKISFDTLEDKYGTKTAIETFEDRTGNCLSFANLFVAMARYAGFKSGFEEIPTPPTWIRDGEVLLVTRHIGATIDIYEPMQYLVDVVNEFGSEKMMVEVTNTRQFMFAPLLPIAQQYALNSLPTKTISDNRAFAQYYNNIGSQYLSEGNSSDAFRYFVKSIKLDPELSYVWSNLGVIYSRNNQVEASEKAFLQALSINRDQDKLTTMTIMSNLARLYNSQGKTDEAAAYEERVRSYRNMNPYYHYSMGEIAFYDGDYEQSVEFYNEAIKRKSDDPQFFYALTLAYYELGEMEKAEKSISKAMRYTTNKRMQEYYREIWEELTKEPSSATELL